MSALKNFDVIVIGAGAAGLAAATRLGSAGLSTLVIEARERIGGRIFTRRDPVTRTPVELGAEFIHGRPPETLDLLKINRTEITEVEGDSWCSRNALLSPCNFYSQIDDILGKMDDRSPDESFLTFLNRCCADPTVTSDAKQRALAYVSGFNAADPALVGVHWLVESIRAEEKVEGDRTFRSRNGYEDLIIIFQQQLVDAGVSVRTGAVVETVNWVRGRVEIIAKTASGTTAFVARRALVTLPLGVLQAHAGAAGAVQFFPPLPEHKHLALGKLEMGKVIRITLRFRHRFWEDFVPAGEMKSLANLGFLFTQDAWFPTWWTRMPDPSPLITGWAPFSYAERLSGKGPDFVVARAVESLGRILQTPTHKLEGLLESAYSHDWQSDPYSRGAYSYGAVGSDGMQAALGSPVEGALYFAGEATDVTGNNGTVHGAIASGLRAAAEILADTSPGTRQG